MLLFELPLQSKMKLTQRYISSLFALALVCTACGHKAGKSSDSDSVTDAKEQQK